MLVSLEGWERYARLARGQVISEQSADYVKAVEVLGAGPGRVVFRHLLPNIAAALVVQATLNFPGTILLETLSFLSSAFRHPAARHLARADAGGGPQLPAQRMVDRRAARYRHLLTTLAMSLFGDWLRDRLDPTVETGRMTP